MCGPPGERSNTPTLTWRTVFHILVNMTDQSVTERKHTAILDAARTVFSREGYAATSVDEVAAEAGIAKGTVYLYFKSKEELYLAALARDLRMFANQAREEMENVPTFREKIETFLRVRLEYCRAHEDFLRIYLSEYGKMWVNTPTGKELRRLQRHNMRHVASVVQKAIDAREIRNVSAPALAATLFDIARGLIERRLLGWKEFQVRGEIRFATDLLWQGIGTVTPPRRER
jgi:AcrR family transcriptional regulator